MKPARAELIDRDLTPADRDGVELVVRGELDPGDNATVLELVRRIRDKHRARTGQARGSGGS